MTARIACAQHATDAAELALFLAMLGLDEPQPSTGKRPRYYAKETAA